MKIKKTRGVGILINENKILLIQRRLNEKDFWVFPGGSVEENESIEEAVIRELKEETSIDVEILKLLYKHTYPDVQHEHYFYLCKYISGEPKLGEFNEMDAMNNSSQIYIPKWVELSILERLLLYPLEIRDRLIEDLKNDFINTPKKDVILTKDLRQEK